MTILLWLSLAFCSGILVGAQLPLPLWGWLLPTAATAALALTLGWLGRRKGWDEERLARLTSAALVLAAALLGAVRYHFALPPDSPTQIAWYADSRAELLVTGTVLDGSGAGDSQFDLVQLAALVPEPPQVTSSIHAADHQRGRAEANACPSQCGAAGQCQTSEAEPNEGQGRQNAHDDVSLVAWGVYPVALQSVIAVQMIP